MTDMTSHDSPTPCPVCAFGDSRSWFNKSGHDHFRCAACGHGFVHPVPARADIDAFYAALDTGLSSDCSWSTEPRHKIALWQKMLTWVAAKSGIGPLLDLGCGGGQFLQCAASQGWSNLAGVEISPRAAEQARATAPATIHEGAWRSVRLEEEHFACVALLDVLEHDPEPKLLLRQIHGWLRPGGCVVITVPNVHGLSLRIFGRNSMVVIPPEHLSYFSRNSLTRLLSDCGYEVLWQTTCDLYLKEWLRFLPKNSPPNSSAVAQQRAQYDRLYNRATGHLALWAIGLINRLLGATGVGDQLVVIAQRTTYK